MGYKMRPKSPMMKKLVGNQHKLPAHLKQAILDSPAKMKDLSGDGKITKKDVLIGRGVLKKDPDNKKEVRRENKQVRKLKRLRKLESKGKTDTKRYSKLKKKVYSPFNKNEDSPMDKHCFKKKGCAKCGYGSTTCVCGKSPAKLKDACYYKAKRAHKVFPSAYASGMIAKCRKNKGKKK